MLCSFSSEVQDTGYAAIAASVDNAVYITVYFICNTIMLHQHRYIHVAFFYQNFRKAVEEEWKGLLSHRCKLNVSFEGSEACVKYPSTLKGWNVISDSIDCSVGHELGLHTEFSVNVFLFLIQLSEEDVDYQKPEDLTLYDYPPRVIFQMTPSENSEPCTIQFGVTGMTKQIGFQFPLRGIKHCVGKTHGMFMVIV